MKEKKKIQSHPSKKGGFEKLQERQEGERTPGLFSHLRLNQHSACGIGHLLTAGLTVVEAEVTG